MAQMHPATINILFCYKEKRRRRLSYGRERGKLQPTYPDAPNAAMTEGWQRKIGHYLHHIVLRKKFQLHASKKVSLKNYL